jgi:type IV secretion system protein VirB2
MHPRKTSLHIRLAAVLVLASIPILAQAQDIAPVSSTLDAIHGFMQSTAIRTLAAIAVIGLGITAMLGRLRWAWAGSIIGGIVLIFGADSFVSFFTSSSGGF